MCRGFEKRTSAAQPNTMEVNGISVLLLRELEKNKSEKLISGMFFRHSFPVTRDNPQNLLSTLFMGSISLVESSSDENCPQRSVNISRVTRTLFLKRLQNGTSWNCLPQYHYGSKCLFCEPTVEEEVILSGMGVSCNILFSFSQYLWCKLCFSSIKG